jgi:hypothetical protein
MGSEEEKVLSLSSDLWVGDKLVSPHENDDLMRSFSAEELDWILKDTKFDTAPGPDGLPVIFFKKFWPLLRNEVLAILNGFALGTVDIARLNFGILSLIPKVPGADNIKQFRPIALINVIFKLVSKAYAHRLSPVAHRIISQAQTAFIKDGSSRMDRLPCMKSFMRLNPRSYLPSFSSWTLRRLMTGSTGSSCRKCSSGKVLNLLMSTELCN